MKNLWLTEEERQRDTIAMLKDQYEHGHPDFIPIMVEQINMHDEKNHDYARGGDPLGNFRRVSAILSLYPNFPYNTPVGLAFIYALKQLDAEAWSMCVGGEFKVEGFTGRTNDQAIYANIRRCIRQEEARDAACRSDQSQCADTVIHSSKPICGEAAEGATRTPRYAPEPSRHRGY